jgi:predicted nucleic acid-binding protein
VSVYFFDSSALVKRYISEVGSAWVQSITDPAAASTIFIAQITGAEVVAAISRRVGNISATDAANAIAAFRYDFANQYDPLEITDILIAQAMDLAETYRLRGYDSVQLAAAVEINRRSLTTGISVLGGHPLVLVSADDELNHAANAEGLPIEDPRNHPP